MINDKVKAVLSLAGKRIIDLAGLYGYSKQSMNNKFTHDRFSAEDLIRIADFTGCRVGFVLPDGEHIFLTLEDCVAKDKSPDAEAPGDE